MPNDDPALVDTNVLVYALSRDAPLRGQARALLDRAQAGDVSLCVAPQILAEFFSIVTNPRRVTDPRSVDEALAAVEQFLISPGIGLLNVPVDVVARWVELAR